MLRFQVEFSGEGVTGPSVNTLYFSGDNATQAQGFAEDIAQFWSSIASSICGGQLQVQINPEVTVMSPTTGQTSTVVQIDPPSVSGGVAGAIAAKATQGLITTRTGFWVNGRQLTGKIYVPSLLRTALSNDGALGTTARGVLDDAIAQLISDSDIQLVVWSRTHLVSHRVIAGSGSTRLAVLRSRRD